MSFWDTLLGGSSSTSTSTPIIGGGAQNQFWQALMGGGMNTNGWPTLQGQPGYTGQLSPGSNTNLDQAYGGWSPTTQGTDYMSQQLGGYGMGQYGTMQNNMQQYGGIGGYPTDLMHNMAQYGGTGGAGNYGMSNLMQYGAAGPAGQGLNNMSQFGTTGTWGNPLQQMMQGGGGMGAFNPLGQLASGQGNASTAGLQSMIAGGGNPIDQLPAWNSMVGAQQHNINEGQAQLAEQMGASGNRFSTAFGTAAADYQNQAVANQNAMLGQMVAGAGENAQNRLLSASGTFGGMGAGAAGQLAGYGAQAGGQLASFGAQATNQMSQNSMYGAGQLFGGENQGALSMYNAQNSTMPAFMNYGMGQQQLGQSGALGFNNMLMGNLGFGAGLGQQQYNNAQSGINNQYQNWLYQQPQNNPLLPYMFGAATGYTGQTTQNSHGGLLPGLASLGGAALGAFSDIRLKEDIVKVGTAGPLNLYSYRYKGLPEHKLGFMAQEVYPHFPEAVIPGNDTDPWMIKPNILLEALARQGVN